MNEWLLINDTEIAQKAIHIITDIKGNIYKRPFNSQEVGLMGGSSGEILFLLGYYELTNESEVLDRAIAKMDKVIEFLNFDNIGYSFATGLSGIGWCIDLMYSNRYIENCSDEIFEEADKFIFNRSIYDLRNENYDYLHAGLGAAFYFLNKADVPVALIREYIYALNQVKQNERNMYYLYENSFKNSCNWGLSHGMPSIISFLTYVYKKNIESDLCLDLIRGFAYYVLNNMNDITNKSTYFSYNSSQPDLPSRLAWCYGDLGVGYALHSAGVTLNDSQLMGVADEILDHTSKRCDLTYNGVVDTCLCHGAAGIASIYQILFNKDNKYTYKQAFSYWTDQIIKLSTYDLDLDEYVFPRKDHYLPLLSFLEGSSGVGLSLISGLKKIELNWQDSLLLC